MPDRSKQVHLGSKPDSKPPRFYEAKTKPRMPVTHARGPVATGVPLHDTLPEIKAAKIPKIMDMIKSSDPKERLKACRRIDTLILATEDSKMLTELVGLALDAFNGEKDAAVISVAIDCFAHATSKGKPLNTVLGGIVVCLSGDDNEEQRQRILALLEAEKPEGEARSNLTSTLRQLLSSTTERDVESLAEIRSQYFFEANRAVRSRGCRYLIRPSIAPNSEANHDLLSFASGLSSSSLFERKQAMKSLIAYVTGDDSAREVLGILPSNVNRELECVRNHCIEKLKEKI